LPTPNQQHKNTKRIALIQKLRRQNDTTVNDIVIIAYRQRCYTQGGETLDNDEGNAHLDSRRLCFPATKHTHTHTYIHKSCSALFKIKTRPMVHFNVNKELEH